MYPDDTLARQSTALVAVNEDLQFPGRVETRLIHRLQPVTVLQKFRVVFVSSSVQ